MRRERTSPFKDILNLVDDDDGTVVDVSYPFEFFSYRNEFFRSFDET